MHPYINKYKHTYIIILIIAEVSGYFCWLRVSYYGVIGKFALCIFSSPLIISEFLTTLH